MLRTMGGKTIATMEKYKYWSYVLLLQQLQHYGVYIYGGKQQRSTTSHYAIHGSVGSVQ